MKSFILGIVLFVHLHSYAAWNCRFQEPESPEDILGVQNLEEAYDLLENNFDRNKPIYLLDGPNRLALCQADYSGQAEKCFVIATCELFHDMQAFGYKVLRYRHALPYDLTVLNFGVSI